MDNIFMDNIECNENAMADVGNKPCALCSTANDLKKKRKRLYGTGCFEENEVLNKFIKQKSHQLSLESFVELKNKNAFLFVSCQKILLKLKKLQEQIDLLENDLSIKINHLHCLIHSHGVASAIMSESVDSEPSLSNVCLYTIYSR